MKHDVIRIALANRFSKLYAFFQEFRPFTGFAGNVNQIDAVAVGLYDKDSRIIAFEIKASRPDFKHDVAQFQHKHRFAIELSHEFYYVCPWNMIDKSEVPEIAGLMCINKGNKVVVKKQAQQRNLEQIPLKFFQAFARNFGAKIDNAKVPIQFLNKKWTQEEFKKEMKKEAERQHKYLIKFEAEDLYKKKLKQKAKIYADYDEIVSAARALYDNDKKAKILKLIREGWDMVELKKKAEEFAADLTTTLRQQGLIKE